MLISGVAVVMEGSNIWFRWLSYNEVLVEDYRMSTSGTSHVIDMADRDYYWVREDTPRNMSRYAADIRVEGNITCMNGSGFDFVALDGSYGVEWFWGRSYRAYIDVRNVTSYSFALNLSRMLDVADLMLGVVNYNVDDIVTSLSAAAYWKEKEVIEPTMAGVGLFTLAKLTAGAGFILIVVASVMKLRKLDEQPYRAPFS